MSITNIKKINVRSPFYIEVKKDPDDAPVEVVPTDLTTAISCGQTVVVGEDVGIRKYTINQDARTGDHTLNISNVTAPVKFSGTWDGTTVTTKYIGQEAYRQEMLDAGILAADLDLTDSTDPISDTLVVDKTTATPALIEFKAESPIIHQGYEFDLACPDAIADVVPTTSNSVVIFSAYNEYQGMDCTVTMNGTTLSTPSGGYVGANFNKTVYVRHVFSDYTPSLEPDSSYNRVFFRGSFAQDTGFKGFDQTHNTVNPVQVTYHPETVLNGGVNVLIIEGGNSYSGNIKFKVSKHPVYYDTDDASYYIMSSNQNATDLDLVVSPTSFGKYISTSYFRLPQRTTIKFRGSNSTDLEIVEAFTERKNPSYDTDPNSGEYTDKENITVTIVNVA